MNKIEIHNIEGYDQTRKIFVSYNLISDWLYVGTISFVDSNEKYTSLKTTHNGFDIFIYFDEKTGKIFSVSVEDAMEVTAREVHMSFPDFVEYDGEIGVDTFLLRYTLNKWTNMFDEEFLHSRIDKFLA